MMLTLHDERVARAAERRRWLAKGAVSVRAVSDDPTAMAMMRSALEGDLVVVAGVEALERQLLIGAGVGGRTARYVVRVAELTAGARVPSAIVFEHDDYAAAARVFLDLADGGAGTQAAFVAAIPGPAWLLAIPRGVHQLGTTRGETHAR